jgi:peroxiredoxin
MAKLSAELGLLKDELDAFTAEFLDMTPDEVKEVVLEKFRDYAMSEILDHAFREGDILPDFSLPDADGNLVSLVDLRVQGPVVITFFRGSWCPYCNRTLRMIRKYYPHFKARGATVVAISPQTVEETEKMSKEENLTFHMLSDAYSEYAQTCNIAFEVDEALRVPGVNDIVPNYNYGDDDWVLPVPAAYIIDTNGKIVYSFLDSNPGIRAEPVDLLNALPPLKTGDRKTLNEELEYETAKLLDKFPEQSTRQMFSQIQAHKEAGMEVQALQVGEKAPAFKLPSTDLKLVDSQRLLKRGPLIVTFYHGHWSSLCLITLQALQRHLDKFEAKGATLVAISCQSTELVRKAANTSRATFTMLSDHDNKVAKQFQVKYEMDTPLPGNVAPWPLPMTSTYVIDTDGTIVYSFVDCNHTKRAEPSAVLKAIPVSHRMSGIRKRGPFSLRIRGWFHLSQPSLVPDFLPN